MGEYSSQSENLNKEGVPNSLSRSSMMIMLYGDLYESKKIWGQVNSKRWQADLVHVIHLCQLRNANVFLCELSPKFCGVFKPGDIILINEKPLSIAKVLVTEDLPLPIIPVIINQITSQRNSHLGKVQKPGGWLHLIWLVQWRAFPLSLSYQRFCHSNRFHL